MGALVAPRAFCELHLERAHALLGVGELPAQCLAFLG
jgi:hypothetical protein